MGKTVVSFSYAFSTQIYLPDPVVISSTVLHVASISFSLGPLEMYTLWSDTIRQNALNPRLHRHNNLSSIIFLKSRFFSASSAHLHELQRLVDYLL